MIKDIVVKITTYQGFNGSGWRITNLEVATIPVEGKTPQTRLNKASNWCASMCKHKEYTCTVYEVIGEKSPNELRNGINDLRGFYDTL